MKKWWKIIIGVIIIGASLCAMYFWNQRGREMLRESEITEPAVVVVEKNPKELALEKGKSFFPLPFDWIMSMSSKMEAGDYIGIYASQHQLTDSQSEDDGEPVTEDVISKLGLFQVAVKTDDRLEIVCTLKDYLQIRDAVQIDEPNLILVMEAANE